MNSHIPKVIKNIIYNYQHQLKFADVMDELLEKYSYVNQHCSLCNTDFVSFKENKCSNDCCDKTFCDDCYNFARRNQHNINMFLDDIEEYFNNTPVNNPLFYSENRDVFRTDLNRHIRERDIERRRNRNTRIESYNDVYCDCCGDNETVYFQSNESEDEVWEDLDWQDRYGNYNGY